MTQELASNAGVPDRTEELSFEEANAEAAATLIDVGVVVVKDIIPADAIDGIGSAYRWARRWQLPRRAAAVGMRKLFGEDSSQYERIRAKNIKADPNNLPPLMCKARKAIEPMLEVNQRFFEHAAITDIYGIRQPNFIIFSLAERSRSEQAFGVHQDGQGHTGLAQAPQTRPTLWGIGCFTPDIGTNTAHPPVALEFVFRTEIGDDVVLTERTGPAPTYVNYREGERTYLRDGSRIHAGLAYEGDYRYSAGLFHQEVAES